MRRLILFLAIAAVAMSLVPAPVAQAQDACGDYSGWMACGALNDCEGYELLRVKLECWKRCHRLYCV